MRYGIQEGLCQDPTDLRHDSTSLPPATTTADPENEALTLEASNLVTSVRDDGIFSELLIQQTSVIMIEASLVWQADWTVWHITDLVNDGIMIHGHCWYSQRRQIVHLRNPRMTQAATSEYHLLDVYDEADLLKTQPFRGPFGDTAYCGFPDDAVSTIPGLCHDQEASKEYGIAWITRLYEQGAPCMSA
ncbi:hypothetical protein E4U52_002335 [Claviceps spartinae]|nr:hypothetical protein E4U52_002335 [Claviceps spartinae]